MKEKFTATAPGKIILFGEHAVVYQRPAIAIPVHQLVATTTIQPGYPNQSGRIWLDAPQVFSQTELDLDSNQPLGVLLRLFANAAHIKEYPPIIISISSTIPVASGMGSGASISVATLRALQGYLEVELPVETLNSIAYQVEKIYHGTPSGIDNTVITYEQPIYFIRNQPFQKLNLHEDFKLVIADTGIRSTTLEVVTDVRKGWQEDPQFFNNLFDQIEKIVNEARRSIENGPITDLGPLMTKNQAVLKVMGVSCPRLDYLVDAALFAGALGAKLTGGGRGGNMIALVNESKVMEVRNALMHAGAKSTWVTTESPNNHHEHG